MGRVTFFATATYQPTHWIPTTQSHLTSTRSGKKDNANWCVNTALVKRTVRARTDCPSAFHGGGGGGGVGALKKNS